MKRADGMSEVVGISDPAEVLVPMVERCPLATHQSTAFIVESPIFSHRSHFQQVDRSFLLGETVRDVQWINCQTPKIDHASDSAKLSQEAVLLAAS